MYDEEKAIVADTAEPRRGGTWGVWGFTKEMMERQTKALSGGWSVISKICGL